MRNWYVITGGPSAGKTSIINALAEQGFHIEHESARLVIDEALANGQTIEELRGDQEEQFQEIVFDHKLKREQQLDSKELIFFDRGMQDTFAYYQLHGFTIPEAMQQAMDQSDYKKVFLLESHGFEEDYARTESEAETQKLFRLLKEGYQRSGLLVEVIPTFSTIEERIDFFLDEIRDIA
ncbi:MAG: ATP-binding protein [Gammaproteobacteria bacterium]|nr:ATP-binding protein [Gammaproteobacteria bacterium]